MDCDFEARGGNIDEVIEHCAEHARNEHNMRGMGADLYVKIRRCLQTVEETATPK
jgi:predicted small metal-binding protein